MALPDFVIIGAMKCGTTTLASQLGAQPGIFMSTPKEPNFFSDDAVYAQGIGWYRRLFDPAPDGTLRGEASTHYTKLPTYPDTTTRLSETLEDPKLIYLIRDPMARAVSHYIHEWTQGVISSDLETALDTHPVFPVTRDQLTMLEQGNVTSDDDLRALTGREPIAFNPGNLDYLRG